MKNDRIPFDRLRKLLLDLGFKELTGPGVPLWFEHPPSGTILIFRKYRPEEKLNWWDVATARRQLDENGVLEADEFEARLHQAQV